MNNNVFGLEKWQQEYNDGIYDIDSLETNINSFMKEYEMKIQQEKEKLQHAAKEAEEDGWIKVNSKHKKPLNTPANLKQLSGGKNAGLFPFQIKEKKMENLALLRKGFEEDKKRILVMRESRKFKP